MSTPSNTVFISYRRDAAAAWAIAVYQDLKANGIDAFYDLESIRADQFDTLILNQIAARPYFATILTPGTLERCTNDGDWVRRKIEEAIHTGRKIVPLYTPSFQFDDIDKYLQPDIARELKRWNGIELHQKYFSYALADFRTKYLIPVVIELKRITLAEQQQVQQIQSQADAEPAITESKLKAQEYFGRALSRNPLDYDGQIVDYTEAIRLDPLDADAYNNRGSAYDAKRQYDSAIYDYDQAIRLDPNFSFAYNNRGGAYRSKGHFDAAIRDLDQAIQLDPNYAAAYSNRGIVYKNKGQYDDAIYNYDQAIRLNPNHPDYHNNRGIAYFNKGQYDDAIRNYDQAIHLNFNYPDYYNNRGVAYFNKGQYDDAIRNYDQAIRLDPNFVKVYFNRANTLVSKGQYGAAIDDYNQAIRLDSKYEAAYYNRAVSKEKIGDYRGAATDYGRCLELNLDHPQKDAIKAYVKKYT